MWVCGRGWVCILEFQGGKGLNPRFDLVWKGEGGAPLEQTLDILTIGVWFGSHNQTGLFGTTLILATRTRQEHTTVSRFCVCDTERQKCQRMQREFHLKLEEIRLQNLPSLRIQVDRRAQNPI